jgi:isoleucyl-tRNA synthetase
MGSFDLLQIEKDIHSFWEKNKVYDKAKAKNMGKKAFYFLDGPPYTSGRIHLGQAWNKALKDSILRYKRMKGFDVWDRAGYDMHGLPTENKVMEKLGLKTKDEIPKIGIAKFVRECKELSVGFMKLMNDDFKRMGVWMDFANAYQSIKNEFIEGEWWLVKRAHENGRLYEGEKVMHWCPSCATALAKHELEYSNVTDESIFLRFKVKGKDEFLIIWTTTPWTIAYNLGVMVNPEEDYVRAQVDNEIWIVAKKLANVLISSLDKHFKIIDEFKGEELEGLEYEHPFNDVLAAEYKKLKKKSPKVHTVLLSSEYVDMGSGSGLVHCAPGCGPEDYEVGHKYGILPYNTLDENGKYDKSMKDFAGWDARKDNARFIEGLDKRGSLIAKRPVEHEYAHCWRCKNAVVFRTTKQWFFKVEDLKERMKELNKDVKWVPDWAGANWFDSWLNNLRDNGITRQRYWGTPLPIWRCKKCREYTVVGSMAELRKLAGKLPRDLHRPSIDRVTIKCKCGGVQKRIPDILDVWIDAGTTSWTCLDYPQKDDCFNRIWPADFILEGKDQIRGWFNLLLVASMVSMGKHSYKACYMHGFVQDASGRKMSKSLGNIISPYEVIDKYGADTLRYYMIGGANPGLDINYNMEDTKIKHKNLTVLWNIHRFLIDYANNTSENPSKLALKGFGIEEKYIISKMNSTIAEVTRLFEGYRLNEVPEVVEELFLELSRTYMQLVREKSSVGSKEEKRAVLYAIYNVLMTTLKLFGPICPFTTEAIYQNLKEAFGLGEESIHLHSWPQAGRERDERLEKDMESISHVVQSSHFAREKINLGVRWPLREIIFVTKDKGTIEAIQRLGEIIKKQVNVKGLRFEESIAGMKTIVKGNFSLLGPRFGKLAPKVIARIATESPKTILGHIERDGKFPMEIDGARLEILKEHLVVEREVPAGLQEASFKGGFLYLNKEMDEGLESEGYAREVMRRVQNQRKKAGLQKSDRVSLFIKGDEEFVQLLLKHKGSIKEKVGAEKIRISTENPKKHEFSGKEKVKGKEFEIFFDGV